MSDIVKQRLRLTIHGAVQGVGFRPFVYRLATDLGLYGWVCNTAGGVLIEVEGPTAALQEFLLRLTRDHPDRAVIYGTEPLFLDKAGYTEFAISESLPGEPSAWIAPEIATCDDCRRELLDPGDRRFRYPFINCTHCGPRYSIISRLPYDRANTSMHRFVMCPACSHEYHDPGDRRFHAQPNACPDCGPNLELWDSSGQVLSKGDAALCQAVGLVRDGRILALKGLGGFHLIVDASADSGVELLRQRKHRHGKPLALMFPHISSVKDACYVSPQEERLLISPAAPIVLLRRREGFPAISTGVAPGNPYLGAMLPYSPLHILLLNDLGRPIVATSGNIAEETICIDEHEALRRLGDLADFFLVHNRPILRAVDDSVVRVILDTEQVIRRARGYAPLPILIDSPVSSILAVGGHLKNSVALSQGRSVFISQHIGDIETPQSCEAFSRCIRDLSQLYSIKPERVVCDLHPDYFSTQEARSMGLPVISVQHHEAHVFSCMGENGLQPPLLGVAWDGSGYGTEGTVWGGEFILVTMEGTRRLAHFAPFPLPGGEAAVREPRRVLLGALYASIGLAVFESQNAQFLSAFTTSELAALRQVLERKINSPLTSSVGRLFDAMAAVAGLGASNSFEGQAAMALEFSLPPVTTEEAYSFQVLDKGDDVPVIIRAPLWAEVLADRQRGVPTGIMSARFHNMLVDIIIWAVRRSGLDRVALSGGCFQNRYLTERAVTRLRAAGFMAYWHQRVPPNDGGLALGQILAAVRLSSGKA
ncbi:MAG: carbamoyltransferase HypF [Candidatus Omnitrophica bacterium]|nr:carbamoyltransferase HypF [Candidatus Omnitrophota bacterium]